MKKLFTETEFKLSKSNDKLPCECYQCGKTFYLAKYRINISQNNNQVSQAKYCSKLCQNLSQQNKLSISCRNCNKQFMKLPNQIKRTKSGNHFCTKSCAATYNNKHKKHGTRRSKLEVWLEEKLTNHYPELEIHFNRKDTINSELDVYIPSLKLAFELNGIFHYEPIYGEDKLQQIQENDSNKFQLCQKQNISFCIIDTSGQKYFKPKSSKKYLDIITNIINQRTMLNS